MSIQPPTFVFLDHGTRLRYAEQLGRRFPGYRARVIPIAAVRANPLGFQAQVADAAAIISPEPLAEQVRAVAADVAPVVAAPGRPDDL